MTFREWVTHSGDLFWEFGDIRKMDTSNIELNPVATESGFDEDEAAEDCRSDIESSWDDSSYYEDIYDDPEDDPDFDGISPEQWEKENPKPDEDDDEWYEEEEEEPERKFKQKEFDTAVKEWKKEYEITIDVYDSDVADWRKMMRRRKREAEEREDEAKTDEIASCVEDKRTEYLEDRSNFTNGGYEVNFDHEGDKFTIEMSRLKNAIYQGIEIPGMFEIVFAGPKGTQTTGTSGTGATAVYTKLLLAIKKLIETETVNGLKFTPAEVGMGLVYQRFYKQYLQPAGFIRVSLENYLRKDFIRQTLDKKDDSDKLGAYRNIRNTNRDVQDKIKKAKAEKVKLQEYRRAIPKMIGKLMTYYDYSGKEIVVYITGFELNRRLPYVLGWKYGYADTLAPAEIEINKIQPFNDSPNISSQVWKLLNKLQKTRNDPGWNSVIKPGFDELMAQYGNSTKQDVIPFPKPPLMDPDNVFPDQEN